jgi:hypothetical protein
MVLILRHMLTLREELNTVFKEENHLYDGLRDVLEGFKEVKMSVPRRIDILAEIDIAATRARDVKIAFQGRAAQEFMLSQTMIFLLLGLIVFVAPMFFSVEAGAAARTAPPCYLSSAPWPWSPKRYPYSLPPMPQPKTWSD